MTWIPVKVPKPKVRVRRGRTPLRNKKSMQRTKMRCGAGSKRRKGSSFPGVRDRKYTTWLTTENPCMLAGRFTGERVTVIDVCQRARWNVPKNMSWEHHCWSVPDRPPIDPAHVGKHRSKGAPDFAETVPLCHAAHAFYDTRRDEWKRATGFSEKQMASAASGYALKYVEQGGTPTKEIA